LWGDSLGAEQHAFEIDLENALPNLGTSIDKRGRGVRDAGIVDQNMNRTIGLVDRCDSVVDMCSLTHVNRDGDGLATCLPDGLSGLFGVLEMNVRHSDLGAVDRELSGSRLANAGTGTGNEYGFSCEIHGIFLVAVRGT
jgi:hypothetical protein